MSSTRKFAFSSLLICGGALVGATLAWSLAHEMQLRAGRAELEQYAQRLMKTGTQLAIDTDNAVAAVSGDGLEFCSDPELAFMRDIVYRAPNVKDIGRTRDGKLYCSTGVGRLPVPRPIPPPDVDLGGMKITTAAPLMISPTAKGYIIEIEGVSVVLNPEGYMRLDEPPMTFSGYLYDQPDQRVIRGFGHVFPLTSPQVISERLFERDGIFYQPLCGPKVVICAVAAESEKDMLKLHRPFVWVTFGAGALLGAASVLILILLYRRARSMERQLRRAVRQGAFSLVYQPIVAIESGAIVGAEALVRWINEDGESVRPDIFIALAEERKFIGEITRAVLRIALKELGDLLRPGDMRLTVNIACDDLTDAAFLTGLQRELRVAGVAPSALGLELTERSTADHDMAIAAVAQLKAMGHSVYIDDFGTGYSSLAYLHKLHIDAIKMDRAFTQTVGTDAVTASVVPQILEMAAQLNLLVVVEGIETAEQADYFRATGHGVLGQGWHFGKPVPASAFRKLLTANAATQPVLT